VIIEGVAYESLTLGGWAPPARWASGCWGAVLLLGVALLVPAPARGNGWAHAGIPFEALLRGLDFEQPETRQRAAESLGFRGQREAVEPLLKRLNLPEESPHVRSALYLALGRLRDTRATPALTRCLDIESREEVRSDCAAALGLLGDVTTAPRLVRALRADASFLVRTHVVDALGHFAEPAAVSALTALVAPEGNPQLRLRAIRALGRTRAPTATGPLLGALAAARSDGERIALVEALGELQAREATRPLEGVLGAADNPELRLKVVIALGAIRDGDAAPALTRLLTDEVPAVRFFAVEGLRRLARTENVVPIARLALEIGRRLGARSVAELLADLGPVLAELSIIQEVALRGLAELDAAYGLDALLLAARARPVPRDSAEALSLAEGLYEVRRTALVGLGYVRSRRAATFLMGPGGLGDPDPRLRATAVRSLGILRTPDTTAKVVAALGDRAAEVRWTAAMALGRLGQRSAVEPLIRRLADPHAEVRREAALSLGYLGDRRALGPLSARVRDDERESVREAAAYAAGLLDH